jgi:hypothetical protein
MAVAAIHYSEKAVALTYMMNAFRWLSASLSPGRNANTMELNETHFATCMMLCTYSVSNCRGSAWLSEANQS